MRRRPHKVPRILKNDGENDVHNLLGLDDGELGVSGHGAVVVVRRVPEDEVSDGVSLPGVHKRDVADDARFDEVLASVDDTVLLGITGNAHALAHATLVELNGDATGLNQGIGTGRGKEGRNATGVGHDSLGERALGDELEADATLEVLPFQKFVAAKGVSWLRVRRLWDKRTLQGRRSSIGLLGLP